MDKHSYCDRYRNRQSAFLMAKFSFIWLQQLMIAASFLLFNWLAIWLLCHFGYSLAMDLYRYPTHETTMMFNVAVFQDVVYELSKHSDGIGAASV